MVHSVVSSSAVDRVVEVLASAKSCPSTGGLNTQLNKVVWGLQLMDPQMDCALSMDNIPVVEGDMLSHGLPQFHYTSY